MVRILSVVALVSIITLSMVSATAIVGGGGFLGIIIAPTTHNQAAAQQMGKPNDNGS